MDKKKKGILLVAVAVIIIAIIAVIIMVKTLGEKSPEATMSEASSLEENASEENTQDFDFTFSTAMLNCKVLGVDISEVTQESLLAHAKEDGLEYVPEEYAKYYVGEGYYIEDGKESYGSVMLCGLDSYVELTPGGKTIFDFSHREHYMLKPYKDSDISVIEEAFLGQTYKDFFDGLAEGLYEKANECPGERYGEGEGHITFNNGYVCNVVKPLTSTWGTDVLTDEWVIVYEENGQEMVVRVCSVSDGIIDFVDIRYKD